MNRPLPPRSFRRNQVQTEPVDSRPSKSQLKREMSALQELGEKLLKLDAAKLAPFDLPEALLDALLEWHNTRSFEGRRRQMQLIGKRMRTLEPLTVTALEAYFATDRASVRRATVSLHRLESWRAELLATDTGEQAFARLCADYPQIERVTWFTLIRQAREQPSARQTRAYRQLFQLLKELLNSTSAAMAATETAPIDDDH